MSDTTVVVGTESLGGDTERCGSTGTLEGEVVGAGDRAAFCDPPQSETMIAEVTTVTSARWPRRWRSGTVDLMTGLVFDQAARKWCDSAQTSVNFQSLRSDVPAASALTFCTSACFAAVAFSPA